MPNIGCGLGGLNWIKVQVLIRWIFNEVPKLIVIFHMKSVWMPTASSAGVESSVQEGPELDEPKGPYIKEKVS